MKNILVPIDGSPASKKAANQAVAIAHMFGSDITFLTVVEVANDLVFSETAGMGYGNYMDITETLIQVKTENQNIMLNAFVETFNTRGFIQTRK